MWGMFETMFFKTLYEGGDYSNFTLMSKCICTNGGVCVVAVWTTSSDRALIWPTVWWWWTRNRPTRPRRTSSPTATPSWPCRPCSSEISLHSLPLLLTYFTINQRHIYVLLLFDKHIAYRSRMEYGLNWRM